MHSCRHVVIEVQTVDSVCTCIRPFGWGRGHRPLCLSTAVLNQLASIFKEGYELSAAHKTSQRVCTFPQSDWGGTFHSDH